MDRRVGRLRRTRTKFAPIQPPDDLAANAGAVDVVLGHEIGDARDARVHLGTTELLVVGNLASRHPDQRWAAEEDLGLLPDHDHVVAQTGYVGPSGGRVAEHQGDGRNAQAGQLGKVTEDSTGGHEDLRLRRKVGAAGFDEVDQWQAVLTRDVHRAEYLLEAVGVHRPTADGRVVGYQHALHATDDADSRHDAAADDEIGPVGDQWRQLEERRVTVDQELDPLAGEQPAALMVPAEVSFAAAQARLLEQAFDLGQLLGHGGPVRSVGVGPGIDPSRQDGHRCTLTCAPVS